MAADKQMLSDCAGYGKEYVFTANQLCKSYGKCWALNGLSMHIPAGSIYGFVGKNGAGKTTLIRLLCGLQFPTSGEYSLFGVKYATGRSLTPARNRIGAIVELPAIDTELTATENIAQQYRILGLPTRSDTETPLRFVGLGETGRKRAGAFSQGMRQKLGLAMAMVGEPDLLVLDEPVNGLDPQGILELRELIRKLNRERGVTFLISSHMLDELSRLATHYGFIDHGHMLCEMTAEELERDIRKSVRVQVSDTHCLANALQRKGLSHRILSDTEADIFDSISLTKLALELVSEDCEIYACQAHSESLEAYFLRLVRGGKNA